MPNPESKIGLSLSFCVKDVIQGNVVESEIDHISAGTAVETPEQIDRLIADYRDLYWKVDPDAGEAVARRLFEAGKIDQPRLRGEPVLCPIPSHWMDVVVG